jgi:hypothetical protein
MMGDAWEDESDEEDHGDEPLGPLVGLVDRLRGDVTELQEEWEALRSEALQEALGEELEGKRGRLKLAEATMELVLQRQQAEKDDDDDDDEEEEDEPAGGVALRAGDEESVSQAAQASVRYHTSLSEAM